MYADSLNKDISNNEIDGNCHCEGCGKLECPGCKPELDPPRFCVKCGKKLTVKISPTNMTVKCKVHGTINI